VDGSRNPEYEKLVDIENLIDYMLCVFYVGDFDAPISGFLGNQRPNNYYALYNRVNPDGFTFFRHDAEHSLLPTDGRSYDRTGPYPAGQQFADFNPQWLHQQLAQNVHYRRVFGDRTHAYFFNDGLLTPEQSRARLQARAQQIDLAIIAESARWGDAKQPNAFTRDDHWLPEIEMLLNDYLPARTDTVLKQIKIKTWYPGVVAPLFYVDDLPQHGGIIEPGMSLRMEIPSNGGEIYYSLDGTDPRLYSIAQSKPVVLVSEETKTRYVIPVEDLGNAWHSLDYDDSQWTPGAGGIGFDWGRDYLAFIGNDILNDMWGVNASCLIRIPFNVLDPSVYGRLIFKLRYDDGFAAYLNGVQVTQKHAPDVVTWNTHATHAHDAQAEFEVFDISVSAHLLNPGNNILALHGMNASTTSISFLISVELTAEQGGHDGLYWDSMVLEKTTQVKAATFNNGQWSALNEAVYSVGNLLDSLRVSELMYHPADPHDEFIELENIGGETVNLNRVRFTNGVDFTFGDVDLEPGSVLVIVRDVNAFAIKYGLDKHVMGQYTGNLGNGGERIELRDGIDQTILSFRYRDGWYPQTDGDGFSLEVIDVINADPNRYSNKETWHPSTQLGGTPGVP
jgi:hypothetical protein